MGGQRSDLPALRPLTGMKPFCVIIRTLLLSVLLPWPCAVQFHVIGPRAPVIALVGEEAVLSCHLSPSMNAQDMEVTWYRDDLLGLVHQYRSSQDLLEHQMPEYQGRTEFLRENITKGLVALRIHPIKPSDGGEYGCSFKSSTLYNEAQFEMLVTVSGTTPYIDIEPGDNRDIKLTCTSMGWYPEPEVQWKDLQGLHLAPASETKKIEENGLFHVESSITVDKSSRADVSCVIRNLMLNVEKEVLVSMADASFPKDSHLVVWLPVLLVVLGVAGATICVLLVRARKSKEESKEENDEQDPFLKERQTLRKKGGVSRTGAEGVRDIASPRQMNAQKVRGKVPVKEEPQAPWDWRGGSRPAAEGVRNMALPRQMNTQNILGKESSMEPNVYVGKENMSSISFLVESFNIT